MVAFHGAIGAAYSCRSPPSLTVAAARAASSAARPRSPARMAQTAAANRSSAVVLTSELLRASSTSISEASTRPPLARVHTDRATPADVSSPIAMADSYVARATSMAAVRSPLRWRHIARFQLAVLTSHWSPVDFSSRIASRQASAPSSYRDAA